MCGKSFTTMFADAKTKNAFQIYYRNMRCPYCKGLNVRLHDDCRDRIVLVNVEPEAICDGCKSYFNCWTGNIDDGVIVEPTKKNDVEAARQRVAEMKRQEKLEWEKRARERLKKQGFEYILSSKATYGKVRFKSTIWNLKRPDIFALAYAESYKSETALVIIRTVEKHGISIELVRDLFKAETQKA